MLSSWCSHHMKHSGMPSMSACCMWGLYIMTKWHARFSNPFVPFSPCVLVHLCLCMWEYAHVHVCVCVCVCVHVQGMCIAMVIWRHPLSIAIVMAQQKRSVKCCGYICYSRRGARTPWRQLGKQGESTLGLCSPLDKGDDTSLMKLMSELKGFISIPKTFQSNHRDSTKHMLCKWDYLALTEPIRISNCDHLALTEPIRISNWSPGTNNLN